MAGVAGSRTPRTVHLQQSGTMRSAPDKRWMALEAEEWFSLDPPGFLWRGNIRPAPLLRVSATDRFIEGHGVTGPEMDSAELQRFLLEGIWFPAFWVSRRIVWQPVDARSAQASLRIDELDVSMRAAFGDDGLLDVLETQRFRTVGKRFELTPWRGRCIDYREANGVLIPHRIAITWSLPQGDFEWLRVSIDRIEYSF